MKRNAIIRIILFSIAIVVLLTILVVGLAVRQLSFRGSSDEGDEVLSDSVAVSTEGIRRIRVLWPAGTITIRSADVSEITFCEIRTENQPPMFWKQFSHTLSFDYDESSDYRTGSYTGKDLVIEVPRNWNLEQLEIEASAADLEVFGLTITDVLFWNASASCRFENCRVDNMQLNTASGDVYFQGTMDTLYFDAASGDCTADLDNQPSLIEMNAASGDLKLFLPADCGFTAELEALAGRFDSDFEITQEGNTYTCGDGTATISISALSGNVTIHKK